MDSSYISFSTCSVSSVTALQAGREGAEGWDACGPGAEADGVGGGVAGGSGGDSTKPQGSSKAAAARAHGPPSRPPEARADDDVAGGVGGDKGVSVAVAAHPGTKGEELGVQRQHRLANVLQRRVDAAQEHGHALVDGLVEVIEPLAGLVLRGGSGGEAGRMGGDRGLLAAGP